jgi:SWI/SNF-related matrix-associated actin-dependent regulator 1 of chromatin subfamily A
MDKEALRRQKELLALQKKAELAKKNEISLNKAAAQFDTTRISIAAALRATYDKETRLRLEAMMAIEDEDGTKALDRIEQLGILTKAKQAEKLNGLKGITETELLGLNETLMAELSKIEATKDAKIKAINASGADQAAKDATKLAAINAADAAEAQAFAKYNDALTKQGGLNDLSFYSKKTQISTLEILELASIETTTAAQLVADEIALAAGLKTVEEIAAARKEAQLADDAAMAEAEAARKAAEDQATSDYFAGLKTKTDAALLAEQDITTATLQGITTVSAAKAESNVLAIDGVGSLAAAEAEANVAALTADADLTTAKLDSIATVAAAQAEANASAIAGVAALATAIRSIPPYPIYTPPPAAAIPSPSYGEEMPGFINLPPDFYVDPGLVNPGGGLGNTYTVTINAGAIASQDEFSALLQETIQELNRKGDPLFTAGVA